MYIVSCMCVRFGATKEMRRVIRKIQFAHSCNSYKPSAANSRQIFDSGGRLSDEVEYVNVELKRQEGKFCSNRLTCQIHGGSEKYAYVRSYRK